MQAGDIVSARLRTGAQAGADETGSVHRATDERTGEAAALKVLDPRVPDGDLRFARQRRDVELSAVVAP